MRFRVLCVSDAVEAHPSRLFTDPGADGGEDNMPIGSSPPRSIGSIQKVNFHPSNSKKKTFLFTPRDFGNNSAPLDVAICPFFFLSGFL